MKLQLSTLFIPIYLITIIWFALCVLSRVIEPQDLSNIILPLNALAAQIFLNASPYLCHMPKLQRRIFFLSTTTILTFGVQSTKTVIELKYYYWPSV